MEYLYCYENQLTSINLEGNTSQIGVFCQDNLLTTIDVSSLTALQQLTVSNNQLTSIMAKNGRNEGMAINGNPGLLFICGDEGQLTQLNQHITNFGYTQAVATPYCTFTPGGGHNTVTGHVKFDTEADGCDLGNNFGMSYIPVAYTNGTVQGKVYANYLGEYVLHVQQPDVTVSPQFENPAYFTLSAPSATW